MLKGEICWVIGDNTYEETGDALIAVLLEIAERLESIKILLAKAGNSEIEESRWASKTKTQSVKGELEDG